MGPSDLYIVAAAVVFVAGTALAAWTLLGDRARGRKRCPRCWYDLSKASGNVCTECGRAIRKPSDLLRTRRHWRRAAAAVPIFLLAGYLGVQPTVRRSGWAAVTPSTVLIGSIRFGDAAWAIDALEKRTSQDVSKVNSMATGMLVDDPGALSQWQWRWVIRECLAIIASDRPAPTRRAAIDLLDRAMISLEDRVHANETADAVAACLRDLDPSVRASVASACTLEDFPEQSIRRIMPALEDPAAAVRSRASIGFRVLSLDHSETLPFLAKLAHDREPRVWVTALGGLGLFGATPHSREQEAFDILLEFYRHDPEPRKRDIALHSLCRFEGRKDQLRPLLQEAVRDPEAAVRSRAILEWGHGRLSWPEAALFALHGLLDDDKDVRLAAAETLEDVPPDHLRRFAAPMRLLLLSARPEVREAMRRIFNRDGE